MSVKHIPNHEKKAFKDLTPEERSAIVEAWINGNADYFSEVDNKWAEKSEYTALMQVSVYRTRPRRLVIPWEVIKPEIKFAFVGKSGRVYGCEYKPHPNYCFYDGWKSDGRWLNIGECIAIDTTGIDWRESLTQRPEGV